MILWIQLRHFKAYKWSNFIPVWEKYNFISYAWSNGIWKSSILEALDVFFNNKDWLLTKSETASNSFICPICLIPFLQNASAIFYFYIILIRNLFFKSLIFVFVFVFSWFLTHKNRCQILSWQKEYLIYRGHPYNPISLQFFKHSRLRKS